MLWKTNPSNHGNCWSFKLTLSDDAFVEAYSIIYVSYIYISYKYSATKNTSTARYLGFNFLFHK